ncbi:MAG: hypothetical protein ACQKBW_09385 [Puniceicoccales bacterium]
MKEGWYGNEYLVLFEGEEIEARTNDYAIPTYMPGHTLLGLAAWDNFIVREDKTGKVYKVLTLPMRPEYREPCDIDLADAEFKLDRDARYYQKVKWYIDPVVFGGDPEPGENMVWLPHKEHVEAVLYWNNIFENMAPDAKPASAK